MSEPHATSDTPDLQELLGLFPQPDMQPQAVEVVKAEEVPEPYRSLLVHEHHMTVTLEGRHREDLHLIVRDRKWQGNVYCRRLLLTAGEGGKVVLTGSIRFHMSRCTEAIRQQVQEEKTPLGKILMAQCSLRKIQPHAFLRVELSRELRGIFDSSPDARFTYGRTAVITCHHRPVVELLEVVSSDEALTSAEGSPAQLEQPSVLSRREGTRP